LESDIRFYRRRANEELAAASRAVTEAARERRILMAGIFLERLKSLETCGARLELAASDRRPVFSWADSAAERV
jgi:Holliday junction resolvase-like predicted endonuclease